VKFEVLTSVDGGVAVCGTKVIFKPDPVGWKLWKRFMRLDTEIKNGLADTVFREQNDLVVDTKFMRTLGDTLASPATRTLDFGTSGVVQHCNYFEQAQTRQFLREGYPIGGVTSFAPSESIPNRCRAASGSGAFRVMQPQGTRKQSSCDSSVESTRNSPSAEPRNVECIGRSGIKAEDAINSHCGRTIRTGQRQSLHRLVANGLLTDSQHAVRPLRFRFTSRQFSRPPHRDLGVGVSWKCPDQGADGRTTLVAVSTFHPGERRCALAYGSRTCADCDPRFGHSFTPSWLADGNSAGIVLVSA